MREKTKRAINRNGDHAREMGRLIETLSHRHRPHQVFADFCEMSALSISNAFDKAQSETREARYLQIVKGYSAEEVALFPQLLGHLTDWLEGGMDDCLGKLFMQLELGNHWKGQFFTPFEIARLMAQMTVGDVRAQVQEQGFITVCEPAAGAGGMLIAMADTIAEQGMNFQKVMHATAIDVDATAVHMCYVQLSLLGVPAVVLHGNALSAETWGHWLTPMHFVHGWDFKLLRRYGPPESAVQRAPEARPQAPDQPPQPAEQIAEFRQRVVAQRVGQMSLFG